MADAVSSRPGSHVTYPMGSPSMNCSLQYFMCGAISLHWSFLPITGYVLPEPEMFVE